MRISAKAGDQLLNVDIERHDGVYHVDVDGVRHRVDALKLEGDFFSVLMEGRSYEVSVEARGDTYYVRHGASELLVTLSDPSRQARDAASGADGPESIVTMMPGKVVRLMAAEGDTVEAGQGLIVVEAMKMENELKSIGAGRVKEIFVREGDVVESGAKLLFVE